jgi:hypothetical protein
MVSPSPLDRLQEDLSVGESRCISATMRRSVVNAGVSKNPAGFWRRSINEINGFWRRFCRVR